MSELVEFIRGCLDADEQTARAAEDSGVWEVRDYMELAGSDFPGEVCVVGVDTPNEVYNAVCGAEYEGYHSTVAPGNAAHIARHDPERVLAEVNAKRAILQNALNVIASFGDWDADAAIKAGGFALWPDVTRRERQQAHDTIDELAQCFRGEPGWRDEWGTQ